MLHIRAQKDTAISRILDKVTLDSNTCTHPLSPILQFKTNVQDGSAGDKDRSSNLERDLTRNLAPNASD